VFDFKVERKKLPENLSKYNKLITVSDVIFKVISGDKSWEIVKSRKNHMQKVTATIRQDHYKTVLQSDTNTQLADEPVSVGGTDQGFSPDELLASSLAACTAITLRMYADRKKYPLEQIEVTVSVEWDKVNNKTVMYKTLQFTGNLQPEEIQRLRDIADKCPTHKSLLNPIEIITEII
jgi:putative redox protein